jgi:hypothetical protein
MALTKISTAMISQSAAAVDLNVDAGTFYVDTTNNRVGVGGKTDPDTPLHVIGTVTATTFAGSGASLTDIPNSALTNSSITINSTAVSLGGSLTLTTANIAENTNLYYTNARADARIAAADTDDLSEGSSNLYYTDARVDARVSGGSLGNITTTGYIRGPATFTIDPAAHGDNTGTVVIAGNLQVDGVTTTINSTTLTVDDKNITLASGSANAAAASGAGFTVDIGTGTNPAITYDGTNDEWDFNKPLEVVGAISSADTGVQKATFANVGNDLVMTANAGATNVSSNIIFKSSQSGGSVAERMRIDSSGNVDLYQGKNLTWRYAAGSTIRGSISVDSADNITFSNTSSNTERMRIDTSGNVGIGTAGAANLRQLDLKNTSHSLMAISAGTGSHAGVFYYDGTTEMFNQYYDNSSDKFILSSSAIANQFVIDRASGNVGIGTSSPSAKLDIAGGHIFLDNAYGLFIGDGNTGMIGRGSADTSSYVGIRVNGGTDKITVKSTGNVGIGASNPGAKLHVVGPGRFDNSASTSVRLHINNSGSNDYASIYADTASAYKNLIINPSGGNVGIGTTNPTTDVTKFGSGAGGLSVAGGQPVVTVRSTANAQYVGYFGQVSTNTYLGAIGGGDLLIQTGTGGTEKMRITSAGNVGIGTAPATWAKLDILGSGGAQTGATQALQVRSPSATAGEGVGIRLNAASGSHEAVGIIGMVNNPSGNAGAMTFHTYNLGATIDEQMRIDNLGNVGIGVSDPDSKLEIKGAGGGLGLTFKTTDASSNETFFCMDGGRVGVRYGPLLVGIPSGTTPATNAVFQVEEAGLLTVLSTGSVGIGTATPQKKFHIEHTAGASEGILISGASDTAGHTAGILLRAEGGEANSALRAKAGIFLERTADYGIGKLHIANRHNSDNVSATISDANITIYNDKVGIGTTTPSAKLTVRNNANWGESAVLLADTNAEGPAFLTMQKYPVTQAEGGAVQMGNGDYIGGVIMKGFTNSGTNSKNYIEIWGRATNVAHGSESSMLNIGTFASGTEHANTLVAREGKVGIGTNNPSSKLEVAGMTADAYTATAFNDKPAITIKHANTSTHYGGIRFCNTAGNYEHFFGSVQTGTRADMVFQGYNGSSAYQEHMRIKDTGNVGINEDTPLAKLHVVGGRTSGTVYDTAVFAGGQNSTSGSGARIYLSGCENDPIARGTIIEGIMNDNGNSHELSFYTSGNSQAPAKRLTIFNTVVASEVDVSIKNGKKIELQTTAGAARGFISAQETNTGGTHGAGLIIATSGGENITFKDSGIGGDTNMVITGGGDVEIPNGQLILGDTDSRIGEMWLYGTGNNYLRWFGTSGNDFEIDLQGTGSTGKLAFNQLDLALSTQSSRLIVGASAGTNSLYGTTSVPAIGIFGQGAYATCGAHMEIAGDGDIGWSPIYINKFDWASGKDARWIAFGVNGFGTDSGNLSYDGTNFAIVNGSDYRLKENIVDYSGGLAKIEELQVRSYNKKEGVSRDITQQGFIAHEAALANIPGLVIGEKDAMKEDEMGNTVPDYQSINREALIPYLVSAIQELTARVRELENS